MKGPSETPFGRYSAREVSHLTGVPPRRIGQWARRGCILRSHLDSPKFPYSYQDVAETLVVRKLLEQEVRLADVRRAVTRLRDEFGAWPLQDAPLQSDEYRRILLKSDGLWDYASGLPGEGVFTPASPGLQAISSALADGGWASVEEQLTQIAVDPEVMSGAPTIRGRRITAMFVGEMGSTANGRRTLQNDYGLSGEEIDQGRRWRAKALEYA